MACKFNRFQSEIPVWHKYLLGHSLWHTKCRVSFENKHWHGSASRTGALIIWTPLRTRLSAPSHAQVIDDYLAHSQQSLC